MLVKVYFCEENYNQPKNVKIRDIYRDDKLSEYSYKSNSFRLEI